MLKITNTTMAEKGTLGMAKRRKNTSVKALYFECLVLLYKLGNGLSYQALCCLYSKPINFSFWFKK